MITEKQSLAGRFTGLLSQRNWKILKKELNGTLWERNRHAPY